MSGLIGKKIGMTSLYDADGSLVACTVIEAGPNVVTHVKTVEKDGYQAVQLAYGERRAKSVNAPDAGHFKKASTTAKERAHEFKEFETELKLGDTVGLDLFEEGSFVTVTGNSKGKGFQGVVKRHGFSGVGEATHGPVSYTHLARWRPCPWPRHARSDRGTRLLGCCRSSAQGAATMA